jgi:translation initiation factor IF-3
LATKRGRKEPPEKLICRIGCGIIRSTVARRAGVWREAGVSAPHHAAAFPEGASASLVSVFVRRQCGGGPVSPPFFCVHGPAGAGNGCFPAAGRVMKQKQGSIPGRLSPIARNRQEDKVRINDQIRVRQVRVIDEEGEALGIMDPRDALREAENRNLDLVEVAPQAKPPVCRIMDYGKYRYEQKRRLRESRKHQHTVTVKEIKYRPKIDDHDFNYKTNHVREFLESGNKVKITIMFRGREMAHPEFGREILQRVIDATSDLCAGEYSGQMGRLEGRNMSIMLTPGK